MGDNPHIWEGWHVNDFIEALETPMEFKQKSNKPIKTKTELKKWTASEQPYYKKQIPEIIEYFAKKYNIK